MESNSMDNKNCEVITHKEVQGLAMDFFKRNTSGEGVNSIEKLFRHPDTRIHTPDGKAWSLEEHRLMHTKWKDEVHKLGEFKLIPLSDNPTRVRAVRTLYWEARYVDAASSGPDLIKAIVGEDWTIEKREDGSLWFSLNISNFFHILPDSAPILL